MPTQHTVTTYKWSELSTQAQDKAIDTIQELLSGAWWDSGDNESVAAEMLYALADAFQSPGYDTYGPGDFPGIEGLTVEESDVERGVYNLGGYITPTTAPALPWPDNAKQYVFASRGYRAYIEVEKTDDDGSWTDNIYAPDNFEEAINDAVNKALAAGRKEVEEKTSEARARERCEEDTDEFYEDGTLYFG